MKKPLEDIQAVVLDAEQKKEQNPEVKLWLEQLEDVVDDLDDLLDQLSTEAHHLHQQSRPDKLKSNKVSSFLSSLSNRLLKYHHKLAIDVGEVRKRVDELASEKSRLKLEDLGSNGSKRETNLAMVEEVIGRNEEKERILGLLLDGSCKHSDAVIAIVGIKGIGKTTFARMIYDDAQVKGYFDLRLWFSATADGIKLMDAMPRNIIDPAEWKDRINRIGILRLWIPAYTRNTGRWLLVLDYDRYEAPPIETYESDLEKMMASGNGKILMTFSGTEPIMVTRFELTGLPEQDAWTLFKQTAFKQGLNQEDPRIFIGKEIVQKCNGIPQAIREVATLLRSKNSLKDWLRFKDKRISQILNPYFSVGDDALRAEFYQKFDDLPSHLKQCFAYCNLFPKDQKIDVQALITLWMAQGFIKKPLDGSHSTLEEIGHEYVKHLVDIGFIYRPSDGAATIYEKDVVMYDLAIYQNRIASMDPYGDNVHEGVRHVILDFNIDSSWQIPATLLEAYRLRTILLSAQSQLPHEEKLSTSTCGVIFSRFKRLRVLDLHDLGIKKIHNSLGKLKQLRYLNLSKNSFEALPSSTTRLLNLQTLKLSNCHRLKELPQGINNLVSLRHLEIDGCFALTRMPLGLGQLKSLQTLSTFVVSKSHNSISSNTGGLVELNNLNNLTGALEILHLERLEDYAPDAHDQHAFLSKKQHLQSLTLKWDDKHYNDAEDQVNHHQEKSMEYLQPHADLKALFISGFVSEFSSWVFNLPKLVKLSLHNCRPRSQFLPSLHQLPFLQVLELERLENLKFIAAFEEFSSSSATEPFFQSLKQVTLWDCPHLRGWWNFGIVNPNSTTTPERGIEKLEIQYCPKLDPSNPVPFYPKKLVLVCSDHMQLLYMLWHMAGPPSQRVTSSSSNLVVNQLESLFIGKIERLEKLPDALPQELTSLQHLHIQDCHNYLTSLPTAIRQLSSLQKLIIENCAELDLSKDDDDGMPWKGLKNLSALTIKGLPKLETLPKGLEHATSLQDLDLCSCPRLKCLPKWMASLASLKNLTIEDCDLLRPRCQRNTGEDWPLISNIPKKGRLCLFGQDDEEYLERMGYKTVDIVTFQRWRRRYESE